ncbi:hypothetical protein CFL01nite_06520 [Corynebacterium flavescens]|uniref:Esterase n=2 Tax=Corynebacteriaceae TaxID=1653 RepID=A0A1L7CLU0_CORFL|nr:hypothetical protein CFLV_06130 [Corynebacterium flavescens]GEB97157.1 hypothetical protein CFL01nite_06520 [Corynebacterium flavescens]
MVSLNMKKATRAWGGVISLCLLAAGIASCAKAEAPTEAASAGQWNKASALGIPTSAPLVGPGPGESKTINLPSGRNYILHVPKDYSEDQQWPVVMVFHGLGDTAANTQAYSLLDSAEALVAYPQGIEKAWSPAPYAKTTGEEDRAFVADILDTIRATYRVDDARVFATGLSNGGGFAAYLGCTMPEVFRAVGTVSAAYYDAIHQGCSDEPVARFDIHGTNDPVVDYHGGTRHDTHYNSVDEVMQQDAKRNRCTGGVRTSRLVNNALELNWTNCEEPLQHIRIAGGGHVWPGGEYDKDQEVGKGFATDRVLDFFGIPGRPSGTQQT